MFFQVYGANALPQWGMLIVVILGLILLNEFARRTKLGGLIMFGLVPLAMTIYCVAIGIGAHNGAEWALNNQTHVYMNGWFHYAKVYARRRTAIRLRWSATTCSNRLPPTRSRIPRL